MNMHNDIMARSAHALEGASNSGGGDGYHRRQKSSFVHAASDHAMRSSASNNNASNNNVVVSGIRNHQQYQQRRKPGAALWLNNGSVSATNDIHYRKSSNVQRNKSFAVVGGGSSTTSRKTYKSSSVADKHEQQKRFSHVQPLVDTGKYSATKHAAHMSEWLKDNAKRPDEKFRRIKASTFVQYVLADAEQHYPNLFGAGDGRNIDNVSSSEHPASPIAHRASPFGNSSRSGLIAAGGDNNYNSVKAALDHRSNASSVIPHSYKRAPKYVLIDVRLPHEFHQNRIRTARNYPYTRTALAHNPKDDVFRLFENHPETVLIVCDDDGAGPSIRVASYFSERNMNNIHLLTGGIARVHELFPMLVCGKLSPTTSADGSNSRRSAGKQPKSAVNDSDAPLLTASSASVIGAGVAAALKNAHSTSSEFSMPSNSGTTTKPVDNRYFTEDEVVELLECMARHSQPTVSTRSNGFSNASVRSVNAKPLLLNPDGSGNGTRAVEKLAQRVRRQLALKKEQFNNKQHDKLPHYSSSASVGAVGSESSRTLVGDSSSTIKSAAAAALSAVPHSALRAEAERHRRRRPWKP